MWKGWLGFIIAIWLIISGFISSLQTPVNMLIIGVLTILIGLILLRGWEGIVNGILGLWLFICGFVTGFITASNFIYIGFLLAIVSIFRIFHSHQVDEINHKTA